MTTTTAKKRQSIEDESATWCEVCHWTEGQPCPEGCGLVLCPSDLPDHLEFWHHEEEGA